MARALATAAVSEPSTLAEEHLFFPDEFKLAVFAPLLLPLLLPLVANVVRTTKERWGKTKNVRRRRQQQQQPGQAVGQGNLQDMGQAPGQQDQAHDVEQQEKQKTA